MGTTHSSVSSSSNSRRARVVAAPATAETTDREVIDNDIPLEVVIRPMPEVQQEEAQQEAAETNTTSSRRRHHGSRRNHRHSHRHRGTTATRENEDYLSFDGRPPPPASNRILQSLTRDHLSTQEDVKAAFKGVLDVEDNEEECLVCSEILTCVGCTVTKLPCGHVFHSTCIIDGWLSKHCTCPTCRYELPTDNAKYEYGRFDRMRTRKIQYLMEKHNQKISTYVCMNPDIMDTTIDSNETNPISEISSATTTASASSSNMNEMDSCGGEAALCTKKLVQVSNNDDNDTSFLWMRDC